MGTNYYFITEDKRFFENGRLHIGKSSAGWVFSLHVYPEKDISSLNDWKKLWKDVEGYIQDEYGRGVSTRKMYNIIIERSWPRNIPITEDFLKENDATKGPNGLVRHKIDGGHCIGHGPGTWDYIIGDFS